MEPLDDKHHHPHHHHHSARTLDVPKKERERSGSRGPPSPADLGSSIAAEVEKMTSEERLSRGLHTPKVREKLRTGTPIIEHVLVVGAPPGRGPPPEYYTTGDCSGVAPPDPRLLFQFPMDKPVDIAGLGNFCYPSGVVPQRKVRRNAARVASSARAGASGGLPQSSAPPTSAARTRGLSDPERALVTDSRPQLENSFVFLLTSAEADIRYGVCVYREAIAYQTETYFIVEQLCFVVITSAPFLAFHFEVLGALMEMPRITELPVLSTELLERLLREVRESMAPAPSPAAAPAAGASPVKQPPARRYEASSPYNEVEIKKLLLTLEQYAALRTPEQGGRLEFFVMSRPRPITMTRPQWEEEAELLQEYGSLALLHVLPPRVFVWLVTACLLEFKVILVTPHKRLLSAVVLSILPLLRPFAYQSPVIPIMPRTLLAYLDAPVPLIVGLVDPPPAHIAETEGFLTINIMTGEVRGTVDLPELPNIETLRQRMDKVVHDLNIHPPEEGHAPEVPLSLSDPNIAHMQAPVVSGMMQSYLTEMMMDFSMYCISDVGSDLSTITVFLRDNFLESRPPAHQPFFKAFLNTQIFKGYEDNELRELDRKKTETRKKSIRSQHSTL